jgi:hypothetical protein
MTEDNFKYDIAISFAGEDRIHAEHLASLLIKNGVRVFYDSYEQAVLWGKDLYQHLQSVYRDHAKYCLIFVSKQYSQKLWTKHELQQAQARAFREHHEYILPVRLDDTEIPGLNATVGYLDLRSHTIEDIQGVILQKLFGQDVTEEDIPELTWSGDLVAFRGKKAASFWPEKLKRSQDKKTYLAHVSRIRYGDELLDWKADEKPCHDCFAIKGEFHVPGCDVEECPVCHGQALGCDCIEE